MAFDASIQQITVVGDAASRISEVTRQRFPEIEWKAIVGMRNTITHQYDNIGALIIWDTIKSDFKEDLPEFEIAEGDGVLLTG